MPNITSSTQRVVVHPANQKVRILSPRYSDDDVGIAEAPVDNSEYVRKNAGWVQGSSDLSGLSDTDMTGLADGDGLIYNLGSGLWEPVDVALASELAAYALSSHNHDADYSAITHNHDADYSDITHNHDADYSDIAHTHSGLYLPLAGGTMTGELQLNARLDVGDGSNSSHEIRIYKADNNVSDHIQFYNGTTRVGEIGCEDTTYLRLNQETNKDVYTPRAMIANNGLFCNTAKTLGIKSNGNTEVEAFYTYYEGIYYRNSADTGWTNQIGFYWSSPWVSCNIDQGAATFLVASSSDRRVKHDIQPWSGGLELINQLNVVEYTPGDWKADPETGLLTFEDPKDDRRLRGLVADEVAPILPSVVVGEANDPKKVQTVNYAGIVPELIVSVQELSAQIEELKAELATLRN